MKELRREPFGFHPLGRRNVDIPGVLHVLRDAGYDGWATVELDEYDGAPGAAARESIRYLELLLAALAS